MWFEAWVTKDFLVNATVAFDSFRFWFVCNDVLCLRVLWFEELIGVHLF